MTNTFILFQLLFPFLKKNSTIKIMHIHTNMYKPSHTADVDLAQIRGPTLGFPLWLAFPPPHPLKYYSMVYTTWFQKLPCTRSCNSKFPWGSIFPYPLNLGIQLYNFLSGINPENTKVMSQACTEVLYCAHTQNCSSLMILINPYPLHFLNAVMYWVHPFLLDNG